MRDRFFYPLLIVVIGVILYLALIPGERTNNPDPKEVLLHGYILEDVDLQKLTAAPGTYVNYIGGQGGQPVIAVLATNIPRKLAEASAGVFGTLGPNYEKGFGGHEIKVTVTARAGKENPLEEFKAGYFTVGAGDSGWQKFTLSDEFEDYSFTFKTNKPKGKPANDFVGIWPGDDGKNETMELKSIRIVVED